MSESKDTLHVQGQNGRLQLVPLTTGHVQLRVAVSNTYRNDTSDGYSIPDEKPTIGYSIPDEIPTRLLSAL